MSRRVEWRSHEVSSTVLLTELCAALCRRFGFLMFKVWSKKIRLGYGKTTHTYVYGYIYIYIYIFTHIYIYTSVYPCIYMHGARLQPSEVQQSIEEQRQNFEQ
jgi:hypothetical protein